MLARDIIEAVTKPNPQKVLARALAGEVFDVKVPTTNVSRGWNAGNIYQGDQYLRGLLRKHGIPHYRSSHTIKRRLKPVGKSAVPLAKMLVDIESAYDRHATVPGRPAAVTVVHINQENPRRGMDNTRPPGRLLSPPPTQV